MRMNTSRGAVLAAFGLFAALLVAVVARVVGVIHAIPLAAGFAAFAAFGLWASARAATWRQANPAAQSVPFSAFGGPKPIVLASIAITVLVVGLTVLLHVLRI